MSMAEGDFSKPTRLTAVVWEWERAWCGAGRPEGRLLRGWEVGRAVRGGRGCEAELGKACLRLAELPGLLMKRRDSIASCSRTLVCGETSIASERAGRCCWRLLGAR